VLVWRRRPRLFLGSCYVNFSILWQANTRGRDASALAVATFTGGVGSACSGRAHGTRYCAEVVVGTEWVCAKCTAVAVRLGDTELANSERVARIPRHAAGRHERKIQLDRQIGDRQVSRAKVGSVVIATTGNQQQHSQRRAPHRHSLSPMSHSEKRRMIACLISALSLARCLVSQMAVEDSFPTIVQSIPFSSVSRYHSRIFSLTLFSSVCLGIGRPQPLELWATDSSDSTFDAHMISSAYFNPSACDGIACVATSSR
jgi:hypothetical protein